MTVVQFVKAIVEEASLKGFDVLWADARECRSKVQFWTEVGPDEQQQSVVALVWVNARFRLHLRSPGAACHRFPGIIRPSVPRPSVVARAVRRQARNNS